MVKIKNRRYKIIISIIFGLLGFIANFFAIDVVDLSEIGFKVNLLWGLIFPLLITFAWGWKYGVISALFGGCQTMWWLWFTDGYGILYSVPVFTFWVIWHGFWADYRKKNSKFYLNKYIVEIPFRIFSTAGFYTIFRYLVSLNPPFWANEIQNNFVPISWVNSVVLKHIIAGYLMLLTVDIILNIKPARKFFKLKKINSNDNSFIIYSFIILGLAYWLIDTIIDYLFYYKLSFFDLLLFEIPSHELFTRIVVFVISLISSLIINKILSEKDITEQKFKTLFNNLEDAVFLSEFNRDEGREEVIEVNNEAINLLKYSKQELMSLARTDIHINRNEDRLYIEDNANNSLKYESILTTKDNKTVPVEIKSRLFELNNKDVILSIARDITESKKRIKKLQEQKEEVQAANQQLTAYSQEITAMNEELDESVREINELNKRFVNMINVVSNLNENKTLDEKSFLSYLLNSAINIVPEADYGKICIIDENNNCEFIDAIGHNYKLLKKIKLSKDLLFNYNGRNIYTSDEYSLDINEIPANIKDKFISALKPVNKSIYINITVNDEIIGRISLAIAKDNNKDFTNVTKHLLKSFASLASAFFSFQRYTKLQGQFTKELITSIIQMLGMHDKYTSGHSENVAKISLEIAEKMGLSQQEINNTYWAGMVHDIGKLLVPLNILNKREALTDEEYKLVKKHPHWGYKALSKSESIKHIARYVLHHHEKWDGTGYPEGISGNEIPVISQILALADAWDAMTSKRAYRNPLSRKEAIEEIINNKGKQFSPEVVDTFLKIQGINN